jgi:hypothetical protein
MNKEQIYVTEVVAGDVLDLPTAGGLGSIYVVGVDAGVPGGVALQFKVMRGAQQGSEDHVVLPLDDLVIRYGNVQNLHGLERRYAATVAQRDALGTTTVPLDSQDHINSKSAADQESWANLDREAADLDVQVSAAREAILSILGGGE